MLAWFLCDVAGTPERTVTYPRDQRRYQSGPDLVTGIHIGGTSITLPFVGQSATLGRGDMCELRDPREPAAVKYLSAAHARIERVSVSGMLRVSNISNGKNDIVVNGEIAHQEFYLGVGDWFMVGKTPYIAVNQEMQSARGDVMEILGIRSHTAIDALLIAAVRDSGRHMLLIGESGSDQERLARMVHQISHRRHKRFYDLGPKAVLDADTRANLRDTEGGTVLVDVLKRGALDQKLAAALMHPDLALRLVIATYSPEKALASFSAPLVHGATHIRIPPVCERREEIAELLDKWFIGSRSALRFPLLRPELKTGLLSYDWPENLKELRTTAHNLMQVAHYRSEREAAKNSELSREQLRGWFRRLGITIKYPLIAE